MAFFCLFEDSNKTFWIGTFEGLVILDRAANKIIEQFQINVRDISCIYEDTRKNLWIGSRVMGVVVYNLNTTRSILYQNELKIPNNVVLAINGDQSGKIWIGTENGGLSIYDPAKNRFYQYLNNPSNPESISFNTVTSIFIDSSGTVWLATFAGVDIIKKDKFKLIRHQTGEKNSLSHNNIL